MTIPNNSRAVTLFLVFKICDVFASNYRNQFVINVFTIFSWPFTAFRPFTSSFTRLTRFTIIALPCKATLNILHWVQTACIFRSFRKKTTQEKTESAVQTTRELNQQSSESQLSMSGFSFTEKKKKNAWSLVNIHKITSDHIACEQ